MESRRAVQTGRILYLPTDKCELTAEEFLSYFDEGFVPVIRETTESGEVFSFGSFKETADGVVVKNGETTLYTLAYAASNKD